MTDLLDVTIGGSHFEFALMTAIAPIGSRELVEHCPVKSTASHGFATGMAIVVAVEWELTTCENPYVFGAPPGSLLHFPNLNGRVLDGKRSPNELVITYGVTRFFDWTGWQPCSLMGALREDGSKLDELFQACSDVRRVGRTEVRIDARGGS